MSMGFRKEVNFYTDQGMYGEALEALRGLFDRYPNHPLLLAKHRELEALEQGIEPAIHTPPAGQQHHVQADEHTGGTDALALDEIVPESELRFVAHDPAQYHHFYLVGIGTGASRLQNHVRDGLTFLRAHTAVFELEQPIDAAGEPIGRTLVAVDAVGAGVGETVFFVRGREASFPFLPTEVPTDAGVVGIVDSWAGS